MKIKFFLQFFIIAACYISQASALLSFDKGNCSEQKIIIKSPKRFAFDPIKINDFSNIGEAFKKAAIGYLQCGSQKPTLIIETNTGSFVATISGSRDSKKCLSKFTPISQFNISGDNPYKMIEVHPVIDLQLHQNIEYFIFGEIINLAK